MKPSLYWNRRAALRGAAAAIAVPLIAACGSGDSHAQSSPQSVNQALAEYAALATTGCSALVQADLRQSPWSAAHQAQERLFIGSAVKSFILAQFLRDCEAQRNGLSETDACAISDLHRTLGGGVLEQLSGSSNYRNVLEAMISHSDNMATDIILAQVGADRVRGMIAEAGLAQTQIPDSTRRLFSYLIGAPLGVDLGWEGMERMARDEDLGYARRTELHNPDQSMLSTAQDMVSWYRQVLGGQFFQQPSSQRKFQRISAMADALWRVVPEDVMAYGKGGSIDWAGQHALCVAGQMRVEQVPVSFCFTLNWQGEDAELPQRTEAFSAAVSRVLAASVNAVRGQA